MRSVLLLLVGFILGVGLMLIWWPQPPKGTARPQRADLQVLVADSYLSRVVQRHVAGVSFPQIRNVRVASVPPAALVLTADLGAGPISAPASVEAQPVAQNGAIQVRIVDMSVAGIPIPSQLTVALADAVNSSARHAVGPNTRITGVTVKPGGLEIYADYAPR
jgi:uncharacterized protein YpmS